MRGLSPAARKHALHQLRPLSASRFRLSQSRAPASELSTHRRCRFGSPRRPPTLVRSVRYALADQRQSPPASGTASEFSVTTEVAFQSHPTCRGPPRTLFARAKRQSLSGQRDPRSDPPKASAPMAEVSLRGLPTSSRARWRWPWQQEAARAWSVCSFGPTKSRGIAPIFAPPILLTSGNCVEFDLGQPPDHSKSRFPRALHWRTTSPRALPSRARFAPTRRCCIATGVDCVTVTSGLAGWPASGQDSFPIRSGSWPESNPEICSTIKDSDD